MKKIVALLLAVLMVLSLAACTKAPAETTTENGKNDTTVGNNDNTKTLDDTTAGAATVDCYQKFDLEMTTVTNTGNKELPEGQTLEDNNMFRRFEAVTGIKINSLWAAGGDAFTQKQNAIIASGEIPDMMSVTMNQYKKLVDSGLIADLTNIIDTYMGPLLKSYYEYTDYAEIEALKVDGKVYGIPQTVALGDGATMFWVRKDWMEKLELEEPTCIADMAVIAKAFMEQDPDGNGEDDTYGIPIRANYNAQNGMLSNIFLNVGGAYTGMWKQNDDGSVVYGSLMDGAKDALTLLNQWYTDGIIPKDFATWDSNAVTEAVTSGKAGILIGQWYYGTGACKNAKQIDPEAEWVCYSLPGETGDIVKIGCYDPAGADILVVRADFEHPEALMCAANNCAVMGTVEYETIGDGELPDANYNPIRPFQYPGQAHFRAVLTGLVEDGTIATQEALDEYYIEHSMTPAANYSLENIQAWLSGKDNADDMTNWGLYMSYVYGYRTLAGDESKIEYARSCFAGTTESMESYKSFLDTYEAESYTKMIMGDTDGKTISEYFDAFVASYLAQGGAEITAEVQAVVDGR